MGIVKRRKILSIEIGYSHIRICEMDQGEKPKIYHFLELDTPELSISDGYIAPDKLEEFKTVITTALKENKIKTKKAVVTLFSSKIITREVTLPEMKEKQLKQVIEENINDYFPIELEDFRVTHTVIDTIIEPDSSVKNKLLVIAAEKKLVADYEKLADMCKLTLIDVDYVGNSVYQALKKEPRFEPEMFVKIEPENTLIMILEDDRLVLQRSLNYGTGLGKLEESELKEAIKPILGTIQRVLHFYSGQSYKQIDKVTILGSGALHIDTISEVGNDGLLHYNTVKLSEDNILVKNEEDKEKIADFIAGIGAGIRSVKLINYKSSIKRVNYLRASLLMVLLYVVMIASLALMVHIPFLDAKEKNRVLKKQAQLYEEGEQIYEKYNITSDFYENFMLGDAHTSHSNDGLLAFLKELEKKLPQDVVVTSFVSNDAYVVLQMEVSSKEDAAGVIDKLRKFDTLMSVSVTTVAGEEIIKDGEEAQSADEDHKIVFAVTCEYYPILDEENVEGN